MATNRSVNSSDPAFYPYIKTKKGQGKNQKIPILNRPGYTTFVPHPNAIVTKDFGVKDSQYAAGYHTGIDIAVPGSSGQKIVWPMKNYDGKVMVSTYDKPGYGHYNIIKPIPKKIDPAKLTVGQKIENTASPEILKPQDPILFGHMAGPGVPKGARVSYDEKIGDIGDTGNSNGAHLHLEYRKSGSPLTYGAVDDPKVRFKSPKLKPKPVGAVGVSKESKPSSVVAVGISKEPKNSGETDTGVAKTAITAKALLGVDASNNRSAGKDSNKYRQSSDSLANSGKRQAASGSIGLSGRGSISGDIPGSRKGNGVDKPKVVKGQPRGNSSAGGNNSDNSGNRQVLTAQIHRKPASTGKSIEQEYLKPKNSVSGGAGAPADSGRSALVGGVPNTRSRTKSGGPGKSMLK